MADLIYLDYNATTPIAPEVAAAMRPYLEGFFGNPSSTHRYGIAARKAVEKARGQVAQLLGCQRDEVVFTSGGSEANNAAIKGTAQALRDRGRHIITSAIEHPAVTEVCRFLEEEGFRISYLPVDSNGLVDPAAVERAITGETILVSVMHANNEVGTIQPIAEIARIARARGVRVHSDGAQSVGKIPTPVNELGVDLYSVAGHKLYGPKGIGALYLRRGTRLAKLIHGADHEQNRRAGTENVLEIVGLGMATEIAGRDLDRNAAHMHEMRERLWDALGERIPDLHLNGDPERRLPNTLNVSFPGLEANTLLDELEEVAASAGAACHADEVEVSPTLEAMGLPERLAMGTIRFSVGRETTAEEVDRAAEEIAAVVRRLRGSDREAEIPVAIAGPIKLTHFTHGLGCACKLRPQMLEDILAQLPKSEDPALLVGTETADDAAVYQLTAELAVVESVDFFTPIVDDPYAFGAIAAANALSDLYAMGARPLFALNLVGFPSGRLPAEVLREILRGASDKAAEAGIAIVGGHSVEDTEPKFGMAVTGVVDPAKVLTNRGARPGDGLVLTKPLGVGILATAAKRGAASPEGIARSSALMATLNRAAAEVMVRFPVNAVTDVTGFGLVGHLLEMTTASSVEAEIWAESVPMLDEALEWATAGIVPGGTRDNLAHGASKTQWDDEVSELERLLLCDAQTSGGLLISLPEIHGQDLVAALHDAGVADAALVGRMAAAGQGAIRVRRRP
ncbi:MAG: selenide, water dikinase SelD [bacterium]|nr:selenide, water dikinase SelD [bacterium]